jgi:hypothetical protein
VTPKIKGRVLFFAFAILQIVIVQFLISIGRGNEFAVVPYLLLAVLNVLQFVFARGFEDESPLAFLGASLGVSTAIALFFALGSIDADTKVWYPTPIVGGNIASFLTSLPDLAARLAIAVGYLLVNFGLAGILRSLERRPSHLLLFAMNPVVLMLLGSGNAVFVPLGLAAIAFDAVLKQRWWLAALLLGLAFGISFLAIALLLCILKHETAYVAREKRIVTLLAHSTIFIVASVVGSLPFSNIHWLFGDAWLGTPLWASALLVVGLIVSGWLIYRVEIAGKDSALYAMLLVSTLLIVVGLDLSLAMLLILLPLAAVFRSLPQLWILFAFGLLRSLQIPYGEPVSYSIVGVTFLMLAVVQMRHTIRETGLFKTIGLMEATL